MVDQGRSLCAYSIPNRNFFRIQKGGDFVACFGLGLGSLLTASVDRKASLRVKVYLHHYLGPKHVSDAVLGDGKLGEGVAYLKSVSFSAARHQAQVVLNRAGSQCGGLA